MAQGQDPLSTRSGWHALDPVERRALRRRVQDGGPVDPSRRMPALWYAQRRSRQLVALIALSALIFAGGVVAGVAAGTVVGWVVVGILGLSLYVSVAELVRIRRLRADLADPPPSS